MADGLTDQDGPILPLRGLLSRTTDVMNYDIFFAQAVVGAQVLRPPKGPDGLQPTER